MLSGELIVMRGAGAFLFDRRKSPQQRCLSAALRYASRKMCGNLFSGTPTGLVCVCLFIHSEHDSHVFLLCREKLRSGHALHHNLEYTSTSLEC